MRACVQRVTNASVETGGEIVGSIGAGLLVLLGVSNQDSEAQADYLAHKIAGLRIFDDSDGKMNRSIKEVGGDLLVVSQFTLYGNAKKGFRPSYIEAAPPAEAERLYDCFVAKMRSYGIAVETGIFRAMMRVHLVNDGPVTILLDTDK